MYFAVRLACRKYVGLVACGLFLGSLSSAAATSVLATWTMEDPTTPADVTNAASGPNVSAFSGTGTLSGVHASSSSDWTTPPGPASDNSYSVNNWATGDYFQFSTSSLNAENIQVSFDATGSNTGPRDFEIAYSTNGVGYTNFSAYSLINASWTNAASFMNPAGAHFDFDLSSIAALNNTATVFFRLIQVGTTPIDAAAILAVGTSRVDNVTVLGDQITSGAVPEAPASLVWTAICCAVFIGWKLRPGLV